MIAAGKLDRQITLERKIETVAPSGAVSETWTAYATVRAELVQLTIADFLSGAGEGQTGHVTFRLHWIADVTSADRITYAGQTYAIVGMVEVGRRRGLELMVVTQ